MTQVNPQRRPQSILICDQDGFTTADVINLTGIGALAVAVVDANGNQITSFGGGGVGGGSDTQFTDNAASGTAPIGMLQMGWDSASSKIRALKVDASQNLTVVVENFPSSQAITGTISVGNFPATQPVSGTVSVSNFPVTQPISGSVSVSGTVSVSNFPATQAVSGTISVGNFPATQPVSGTFWQATQPVSGTVSVGNFPSTQAVSATQLPTALDGSGFLKVHEQGTASVNVTNGSIAVTGTFWQATQPVSGTFWQATQPVSVASTLTVTGTVSVGNFPATQAISATQLPGALDGSGFLKVHEQGTANVNVTNGSVAVTGTFFQATQPVSGTFWQATQPVSIAATVTISGTVTANIGTTNGLALDASVGSVQVATGTTAPTKIGIIGGKTNDVTPQYQPIPLAAAGASVIVSISGSPSVSVSNFPGTQAVSGTVTVSQATAANLNATVTGTVAATQSGTWNIGSITSITNTVTVSGTVTANAAQSGTWTVQPGNTANTTAWLVNGPTLTKGTQGAVGFAVQDLKDSGRTYVTFTLDAVAGVTVEALATMAINKALATSSASSYTVTTGKTLRIQSIVAMCRNTSTTAITAARVRLRSAASAIAATSPILTALDITPTTAGALAGATGWGEMSFPDGLEVASTQQIAISQIASATTTAITVTVVGYEY